MDLKQSLDYVENYEKKVKQAADYIRKLLKNTPEFGIILGSGLGDLADSINNPIIINYKDIPNFPTTAIPGHEGKLIIGELNGVSIIGLKGRKHYYEVADEPLNSGILQVIFPIHVLAELGVKNCFVTNAAGGLNSNYKVGDIMIIKSHINIIPNPLLGRYKIFTTINNKAVERFQPMSQAYNKELRELLKKAGFDNKKNIHEGTYLALTGPSYETEAECIAFRDGLKADAVGMSTAPEVIVAINRGMKVVGFSCITNVISKEGINATNHEEVKSILESEEVKSRLMYTVKKFFEFYNKTG
jgi:purine-nucleoside phosphorylase